ncbi:prolipoprotein diacylglyceryl transferase [bacterium]|nr:prolipoprotein diacylglyceryl transferase [bacterium]
MFWQNFLPAPVIFSIGPVSIHWYGLILVLAIIASSLYAKHNLISRVGLSKRKAEDLFFYVIIFGLIGARFGHVVFFNLAYYIQNPADIIKVWQGGLSIQGALLFGLITFIIWARKNKINFWRLTDLVVPSVALGQAIGRWGNYFNQELFGRPVIWGIPINQIHRVGGYEQFSYFHPTFLYESILNLLVFFTLHKLLKYKLRIGTLTLLYFGFYSLIRFLMEFVRIDQTFLVFGIRLPQLISVLVFIGVIYLIFYINKRETHKS